MLARHTSNPDLNHLEALLHLAGYIKNTIDMVITFRKLVDAIDPGTIQGFSDADWAGEEHSGRSTSGMVIIKNDGPIRWGSK